MRVDQLVGVEVHPLVVNAILRSRSSQRFNWRREGVTRDSCAAWGYLQRLEVATVPWTAARFTTWRGDLNAKRH